jgi:ubiquinone/menaquinone biosynthesis C-methylase UbiE
MTTEMEKTHVKDVYEEIAPHFSNTRVYKWSWVTDFLEKLKKNNTVYDIGCGNGRNMVNSQNQSQQKLNFIGVDNCENFIRICKEKDLNVINSNIIKIPLDSGSADAIICIAVFHHLSSDDNRIHALLEMKRLIKCGGKILLSVWSINQPQKTRKNFNNYGNNIVLWNNFGKIYERYYYIFKLDEIRNLIKKAGLNIIDYQYSCGNEIFTLMKV